MPHVLVWDIETIPDLINFWTRIVPADGTSAAGVRAETSVGRRFMGSSQASRLPASACACIGAEIKAQGCVENLVSAANLG